MADYRLRIGVESLPQWQINMVEVDTVYEIGDLPSVAEAKIVWPSGSMPTLYAGTDSNAVYLHASYGSSCWVKEGGLYGSMVFTYTGEGTFCDQMTQWTISEDTPTWNMWQQPGYQISEDAAIAANADCYFGTATGNTDLGSAVQTLTAEVQWTDGTWLGGFPVNYMGFVFRRKIQESMLGNARWHSARYDHPRYIPASMTGTGSGAIITSSLHPPQHGPFSQGPAPSGLVNSALFDATYIHSGNLRKHFLYAQNVSTKVWTRLTTVIPSQTLSIFASLDTPRSFVDTTNKKLYYLAQTTDFVLITADFTSGLTGVTFSGPTAIDDQAGGPAFSYQSNSVFTDEHPTGKKLFYTRESSTNNVLMYDVDTNILRRLTISGMPPNTTDNWSWGYDPDANRVYISQKTATTIRSYRFTVPSDPTDANNYAVTNTLLTLASGVTIESDGITATPWQYGERGQYLRGLGVILMTQRYNKMLAYKPGA